jgi:hypothetical protein
MICTPERSTGPGLIIKAAGVGNQMIRLLSSAGPVQVYLDGKALPSSDGGLSIDFGPRWREVSLSLKGGKVQ